MSVKAAAVSEERGAQFWLNVFRPPARSARSTDSANGQGNKPTMVQRLPNLYAIFTRRRPPYALTLHADSYD